MKLFSFHTTPFNCGDEENLNAMIEFYGKFRVHPTNFRDEDGSFIQDKLLSEPLDGNMILGNPVEFSPNYDDCTMVLSGAGGLDFCQVEERYSEYLVTSHVLGNFLDTIFNYDFGHYNPDVEIFIESVDSVTGEKEIQTIRLGDYYSTEAYAKRHSEALDELQQIEQQIAELTKQRKIVLDNVDLYAKRAEKYQDGLPFETL